MIMTSFEGGSVLWTQWKMENFGQSRKNASMDILNQGGWTHEKLMDESWMAMIYIGQGGL